MALSRLTITPPSIARNTSLASVLFFSGQRTAIPETQMPRLEKFAKPQSEMAQISPVLGSNDFIILPNS